MPGLAAQPFQPAYGGKQPIKPRASLYTGVTPEQVGRDEYARDQATRSRTDTLNSLQPLMAAIRGSGMFDDSGGGGAWSPTTMGVATGSTPAPVASIAPVDTTAAQDAAFARAKDRVGQMGAGAIAGLRASMGGRGLLGSGSEGRATADVVNRGQGELGDVIRGQAVDQADLAQKTAEDNQRAALTQRGQDLEDRGRSQDLSFRAYEAAQSRRQASRSAGIAALSSLMSRMRY